MLTRFIISAAIVLPSLHPLLTLQVITLREQLVPLRLRVHILHIIQPKRIAGCFPLR